MLKNTFLHVPGVGPYTEKKIWERNIISWIDFPKSNGFKIPQKIEDRINSYLILSKNALREKDIEFFSRTLPQRDWWRLYPEFKNSTAFLDIETTGLSYYYNDTTIIGLFNGKEFKAYVRGHNLPDFKDEIKKYSVLVTYNGTLFDLPFLRSEFGKVEFPPVHIDLRFLLRRLGYTGGLKSVEKQTGIFRQDEVDDIDGFGATILWDRYVRGDSNALQLLLRYNFADVTNLKALMELGYSIMNKKLLSDLGNCDSIPRPIGHIRTQPEKEVSERLFISALREIRSNHNHPVIVKDKVSIDSLLTKLNGPRCSPPKVVGIDLRASDARKTGMALQEAKSVQTALAKTDSEIIELVLKWKPALISIDSPLSLPKGRDCTSDECECRSFGISRECERTLRSRNVNVFWCLIQSMQGLTERGMRLARQLRELGFEVIESYPGAAQDILGITRKKISTDELKQGLIDFGIVGHFEYNKITHDELDAITSALVGYFYVVGHYEALGNEDEGYLIVPESNKS